MRKIIFIIATSIKHLHDNGMVHRDIKLENILCVRNGNDVLNVKLCDFGLSMGEKPLSKCQVIVGTAHYVAPEIIMKHTHSKCQDMWSLGVMAYLLLTGCYPFEGSSNLEVEKNIVNMLPIVSKIKSKDAMIFVKGTTY